MTNECGRIRAGAVAAGLAALAAAAPAAHAQLDPIAGEALTVHLLTVGPGDRVEELFGHNALLVRDTVTGYEETFNYGLFDPSAAGFLFSFFMGHMMYRVAPLPLDATLASYRASNRTVWAQELNLEPAVKAELLDFLLTASLPANSRYRYQYFLDNCSTRIRDALDHALGGQLRAAADSAGGAQVSWRHHTRRLTGPHLHFYVGIDLLLGPRGDDGTTPWQEMWVPMKLRDAVGAMYVTGADGARTRLVRSEAVWVESDRDPEPVASRSAELLFLCVGAVLALLLLMAAGRAAEGSRCGRVGLTLAGTFWGGLCFVVGTVLALMHATDHEFMYWNRNFLVFSPLGAGVAVALVQAARTGAASTWGRRVCVGALGLAVLALVAYLAPWTRQDNLVMIAFAMPVHLAACWVVLRTFEHEHALPYHAAFRG